MQSIRRAKKFNGILLRAALRVDVEKNSIHDDTQLAELFSRGHAIPREAKRCRICGVAICAKGLKLLVLIQELYWHTVVMFSKTRGPPLIHGLKLIGCCL
jgi:hypothetical protein